MVKATFSIKRFNLKGGSNRWVTCLDVSAIIMTTSYGSWFYFCFSSGMDVAVEIQAHSLQTIVAVTAT